MRESSQISPNQSFPPSRAARRFGLRFAFSNARPPLPPPRAAVCETRPNFGCIVVKPRGAGALGFASPDPTKVWGHPPRARGPSCETRPRLGKNLSLARARGADSSAFLASHILRTIQRDGRDAVGLRLPKPSAAVSRLSRACRKTAPLPEHRFATRYRSGDMRSVFRLRRASRPVWDIAPRSRGEAGFARVGGCAYKLPRSVR